MHITPNRPLPHAPALPQSGRAGSTPFRQGEGEERKASEATAHYLPRQTLSQAKAEPALDYRKLVMDSRYQRTDQGGYQPQGPQRADSEPLQVLRALGAYRDNSWPEDAAVELLPRLDAYV